MQGPVLALYPKLLMLIAKNIIKESVKVPKIFKNLNLMLIAKNIKESV